MAADVPRATEMDDLNKAAEYSEHLPSDRYPVLAFLSWLFKMLGVLVLIVGLLTAFGATFQIESDSGLERFFLGGATFVAGAFLTIALASFVGASGYMIDLVVEIADHVQVTAEHTRPRSAQDSGMKQ